MTKTGFVFGAAGFFLVFFLIAGHAYQSEETQIAADKAFFAQSIATTDGTAYPDRNAITAKAMFDTTIDYIKSSFGQQDEIQIGVTVAKTDSTGKAVISDFISNPISLDFAAKGETTTDFGNGKLIFQLFIKAKPNTDYSISGNSAILLNGNLIPGKSVQIYGTGRTGSDGKGMLFFDTSTGTQDLFFINMENDFVPGSNQLKLKLYGMKFIGKDSVIVLPNQSIYSLTLDYDYTKTSLKDESGILVRGSNDISFAIASFATSSGTVSYCDPTNGTCSEPKNFECVGKPAPYVGGITVTDNEGNVIAKTDEYGSNGEGFQIPDKCMAWNNIGKILVDVNLQRNSVYSVSIGYPQNANFEIHTPGTKTSYYYKCSGEMGLEGCLGNVFPSGVVE